MITRILVPQAFENMEEATVGLWHKAEGDYVARGDGLCDLITEKTTFTLESEGEGTLRQIVAQSKAIVPVGYILAILGDESDELPDAATENRALMEKTSATTENTPSLQVSQLSVPNLNVPAVASTQNAASGSSAGGTRVRATPAARRLARELGVDIEEIAKALPGKVLNEDDVRGYGV
jgi:pyruvate dehydrogenase E2 component (dihydrolipoamide acetyltransferase)